ncbi:MULTISPECIES: ABC transporter permease [Butyricimonas]|uniref:ABC transporter permease n=1 Tax=Butyricimonas TaxID=574697 RepID=UPI0007FB2031|nr:MULTISPECIES: ABC transporter permease [Butyricimonas]
MLRHIFVLFWNQKRAYGGMFVEQIIVFVVLLFCFTVIGEKSYLYFTDGMLNTRNTYCCYIFLAPNAKFPLFSEVNQKMTQVVEKINKEPYVVAFGKSIAFVPYMRPENMNPYDSILIDNKKIKVLLKFADEHILEVFKPQLEEGKWLTNIQQKDGSFPAVITRQLKNEMGWNQGVGKKIYFNGAAFSVVGVIAGVKQEPLKPSYPTLIIPSFIDHGNRWMEFTARVEEGKANDFRSLMNKEFYKMMGKDDFELSIADVEKWKRAQMQNDFITLLGVLIPTVFLFIFAFIGTFGLFWLYSSKRKKEFALRIVVGSTPFGLKNFVITEALVLTVLAWIPGMILFFWVYQFNVVNLLALGTACFVMILFSVFSAWYPAYQVSRINPVEAMREE